jgi:apolipoprotein D and lipocalin family protein
LASGADQHEKLEGGVKTTGNRDDGACSQAQHEGNANDWVLKQRLEFFDIHALNLAASGRGTKMQRLKNGVLGLILSGILSASCAHADTQSREVAEEKGKPAMRTVAFVDTQKYLGLWYEIAHFPNRFQKGCHSATAEYSLKKSGSIRVLNTCLSDKDEKPKKVDGEAKIADRTTGAKLKVTFLPSWLRFLNVGVANYWIIDLDADYGWVVVSEPSRKYMWVLSREAQLDRQTYEKILERAREQELDVSKLVFSRPEALKN